MDAKSIKTLKIEEVGDFFLRKTGPRIRLAGQWLERAGFKAGNRVEVESPIAGVLTLRLKEANR